MALGADQLREAGIEGALRDARRLMAGALGVTPDRVVLALDDEVNTEVEFFFFHYILGRCRHEPVSRLLSERQFWGRAFGITPDVLDPRPETETLVQLALSEPFSRVLDLGTGSGAILVSLLAEREGASGVGTDISGPALLVAGENAARHGVDNRALFTPSDWYADIGGRYDLIVSNPPYIAAGEMPGLSPEVRDFDPRIALTDEADGLTAYRAIAAGARDHLTPAGRLMVEIGPTQAEAVSELFRAAGLEGIEIHPDLDGRDRVVAARNPA